MGYPTPSRTGGVDKGLPGRSSAVEGCRHQSHGVVVLLVTSLGTLTGILRTRGFGECSPEEVSLLQLEHVQEDWGMDWEVRVGLKAE